MSGLSNSRNRRRSRSPGRISRAPGGPFSPLWITVPAIVVLGFASGWLGASDSQNPWFAALHKPVFEPPGWLFPVAWTVLYVLLGIALGWLIEARNRRRPLALTLFTGQMVLNLAWAPLFFRLHQIGPALAVILVMIALTLATMLVAWRVRAGAALLMAPYLAWLCFAAALNAAILQLN